MTKALYLVGGGGHCRACIDVIEATCKYAIVGIVDRPANLQKKILGIDVVATDEQLDRLVSTEAAFHVSVGFIESPELRCRIYNQLQRLGAQLPTIVSPYAYLSKHANIKVGTIVMHDALINAAAVVGENCIINTKALIEHDAVVGNHCHVSTGATVNGGCSLSSRVFVGSNSVLAQGVSVCNDVIIGAGSVIHKDILEPGVYAGNPFRKIR